MSTVAINQASQERRPVPLPDAPDFRLAHPHCERPAAYPASVATSNQEQQPEIGCTTEEGR